MKRRFAYYLLIVLEHFPGRPLCSCLATYLVTSNPRLMASLKGAMEDFKEGRILTHREVFGNRKGVMEMYRISINPRLEVIDELNVLTCQVKTHADYLLDESKIAELQDWLEMKGHLFTPGAE